MANDYQVTMKPLDDTGVMKFEFACNSCGRLQGFHIDKLFLEMTNDMVGSLPAIPCLCGASITPEQILKGALDGKS